MRILKAPEELLDERTDALGFTGRERMEVTDLNNLFLKLAENRFSERVKAVALQVIEERDTKLLLVGSLDKPEVRTNDCLLLRLQIIEEVGLNRSWESEGCILRTFWINLFIHIKNELSYRSCRTSLRAGRST